MNQKATITITDTEAGTITVNVEFEPSIDMKSVATPAIMAALNALSYLKGQAQNEENDEL